MKVSNSDVLSPRDVNDVSIYSLVTGGRMEGNVLFNDALNTFYLRLINKQTQYASDIWLTSTQIAREETRCRHMGYSYRLTARFFLYAPSHRQDSTYHGLCYTSRGALAGTRNSSMGPPHEGSIRPKTNKEKRKLTGVKVSYSLSFCHLET